MPIDPVLSGTFFDKKKYVPNQNLFIRHREVILSGVAAGNRVIVLDPLFFTSLKVVKGGKLINIFTTNDIPPDGNMINALYGVAVDSSTDDFFEGDDSGITAIKVEWPAQLTADLSIICTEFLRG